MSGVQFPLTAKGDRSTTAFNKAAFASVAKALGCDKVAQGIADEKAWRQKYDVHLEDVIECLSVASTLDVPRMTAAMKDGLANACEMDFVAADGSTQKLSEAIKATPNVFETATVRGSGAVKETVSVPYGGEELSGPSLDSKADYWGAVGTIEPDCAEAIKAGAKKAGQLKGRIFLVLGASSEIGALRPLLESGATVAAVMRSGASKWTELVNFAKGTAGTLLVPVRGSAPESDSVEVVAQVAGADLLQDAPGVLQWLSGVASASPGSQVTLCTYLYSDGEANVRLTAAADAITVALADVLGKQRLSLAYLASGATSHMIPLEAAEAQENNFAPSNWWSRMRGRRSDCLPRGAAERLWQSLGGADTRGDVSDAYRFFRGVLNLQGPNYALAQYMRQWRAVLMNLEGFTVSTPIAPNCRTESVQHNATMKAFLDGAAYWRPMESLDADTARAAMFAILVSDLTEQPTAKPADPPMSLLVRRAFHSGLWRCPFELGSLGASTFLLGKIAPRGRTVFEVLG